MPDRRAAGLAGTLARLRARLAEALARRRVPIGFVLAPIVLWLARPSAASLAAGAAVALVGEGIRLWAAGHLEKDREVTSSGPYRWTRHPLYTGSLLMGVGLAIAAAQPVAAALIVTYLVLTVAAAVRTEDARLAARFGAEYQAYRSGRTPGVPRRFSLRRALVANREHRAIVGMTVVLGVLALKAVL